MSGRIVPGRSAKAGGRLETRWAWATCSAAALALLAGLAGCALKVNQEKEVATYRRIVDGGHPTTMPFTAGEPLSLEKAMLLANLHNERIAQAGENYVQALINKDRAASAFLPTISLAPSYSEQDPGGSSSAGVLGGASTSNSRTDVPVTGRMNLFNGFSDLATLAASGRSVEQRRALLLDAQSLVMIDVARTYFQVLRAERQVKVLRASLATQEERVRDARAKRAAGTVPPLDVAQTEAQAASTRVTLIDARNIVSTGRETLAFLIGAPVRDSALVDESTVPAELEAVEALRETALRSRPDLAAAAAGVAAARANVQAALGQYFPSISVNVNYYLSRQSMPTESDWNYLLSANLPIFSAGLIEADVREAWSRLRQARLAELSLRRQIVEEVNIAVQDLQASQERFRELRVRLEAAAEALRQAEGSYRVGLAKNLDVLTAQDALLSAQLQLASEEYDQKVMYLYLLRSLGTLSSRIPGEASEPAPTTRPAATQPATTALLSVR